MRLIPTLVLPMLLVANGVAEDHGHDPAPAPKPPAAANKPAPAADPHAAPPGSEPAGQGLDAKRALERLMQGNQRFVIDVMNKSHKDADRRTEVAKGQHPIAIVVCCSDSRVPPEQLFDVGLGDIFVVRTAGNVIDAIGLGSIEYAVAHLHAPLIVVMGHERCGAVTAAISGETAPGHVLAITDKIQDNLIGTEPAKGDPVDQAMRINAKAVARQIAESVPILRPQVASGALGVVAVRYDLDDGKVELIP
ncbi:carbonic anhydrase [Planctomycetota bacterium]|nr:carbonic anhydrase [Planctomycetota bacterium]